MTADKMSRQQAETYHRKQADNAGRFELTQLTSRDPYNQE